jgi:hypothetical protein
MFMQSVAAIPGLGSVTFYFFSLGNKRLHSLQRRISRKLLSGR